MTLDQAPELSPTRVGIFGGTFDPPHLGHVRVVTDVANALGLERVLWVPAGEPPHKIGADSSPAEDRLAMVRAAVQADDRFEVSPIEVERPGPSYTVDTLRALRGSLGDAELFLIIGVDQYQAFDAWRDPDGILRLARLAVMDRSGAAGGDVRSRAVSRVGSVVPEAAEAAEAGTEGAAPPAVFVDVERIDISSTEVREAIRSGSDVSTLVTKPVSEIIGARGLYRT